MILLLELCCGCGGGERTVLSPHEPAKLCVNTNGDEVNVDGYPCSYLNWLNDNENIAYDFCESQTDTSSFNASSMCCACGGGTKWIPGSLSKCYRI